ncbi:hypothetical protein [uncultured Microbacterium sp.]|uniref:hypothetical protein n=1 Tax=uncultured Microbacterium sp. TaxID=191216 RepID=UPI0030FC339E
MFATTLLSAHEAAHLLRSIGLDLARRVNDRLPGMAEVLSRRTVVHVDGKHVVGVLGSYKSLAWTLAGEHFDKLTVTVRHSAHQAIAPTVYAQNIFTTLAHEIAHAYTQMSGLVGTTGLSRIEHTEDFALVAVRLGLRVVRRPEHPTVIFTPGLSAHGRIEFVDLIERIAHGNLARASGTGYAGPRRFHDLVARASSSPSDPTSSSSTSFIR